MLAPNKSPSNLAESFVGDLAARPETPAIERPDDRSVDGRRLDRLVRAAAGRLADRGVEVGDRVLIQTPPGPLFVAAVTGAIWLGAVPVLIDPSVGRSVYRRMVRRARPDHAWVHPLLAGANLPVVSDLLAGLGADIPPTPLPPERCDIVVDADLEATSAPRLAAPPAAPVDETSDAVIVFSGGTGGVPKGARLSHGAIRHYVDHIGECLEEMPRSDRVLVDTPQQMLCALLLGKTTVPTPRIGRIEFILEAIRSGDVDTYFGSPYTWRQLRELAGPDPEPLPASFRTVLLGSAPITGPLLRTLDEWLHPRAEVKCLYGTTEAGPICAVSLDDKLAWDGEGNYVGRPLDGVSLRIDGADGSDAGEITIESPSLFSGYLGEPAPPDGFATGDVGRVVEGGGLALVGRRKDLIIARGENVYPYAVESALEDALDDTGDSRLDACALVGLDRAEREDETLVLAVSADGSVDASFRDDLKSVVRDVAGRRAVPHHIVAFDELPTTGRRNKIDRRAIRRRLLDTLE